MMHKTNSTLENSHIGKALNKNGNESDFNDESILTNADRVVNSHCVMWMSWAEIKPSLNKLIELECRKAPFIAHVSH